MKFFVRLKHRGFLQHQNNVLKYGVCVCVCGVLMTLKRLDKEWDDVSMEQK